VRGRVAHAGKIDIEPPMALASDEDRLERGAKLVAS